MYLPKRFLLTKNDRPSPVMSACNRVKKENSPAPIINGYDRLIVIEFMGGGESLFLVRMMQYDIM